MYIYIYIYLTNSPHPDNPQIQPPGIPGYSQNITTTTPPLPLPSQPLRNRRILQHGQDQKHAHVSSGFGHGVAGVTQPDAIVGHPRYVEFIIPGRRGGDDPAVREERGVEGLVEGGEGERAHAHHDGVERAVGGG